MRILQLRLSNLNSLKGEWSVDFEHPDFVSDGIFAITGPTGSGKSTLLDAICLALYGQTPRLGKVTASQNDIMSRHTGDCFAEVTFQTTEGTYRCHWSQKRARGKADGNLQSPQHELSEVLPEVKSQAVLASKIKEVAEQIQTLTGMDFEQFTRSMLLAQGSFAAFLQANADERSPILEQITGTQIYTALSLAVHERKTEETQAYKALLAHQESLALFEPAQEEAYELELDEQTEKYNALKAQSSITQTRLEQHKQYLKLQEEQQTLQSQIEQSQQQWLDFAPERERLQRAKATHDLQVPHAQWVQLRSFQQVLQDTLTQHDQARAARLEALSEQQTLSDAASMAVQQARAHWAEQEPRIAEAVAFDLQIENAQKQQQDRQAQQQEANDATAALAQSLSDNTAQAQQLQQLAQTLEQQLTAHGDYGQLTDQLPEIRQDLQQLAQWLKAAEAHQASMGEAQATIEALQQRQQQQAQTQAEYEAQLAVSQGRLSETDAHLQQVLQSQTLAELEQSLEAGQWTAESLREAQSAKQAMVAAEAELMALSQGAQQQAEENATLQAEVLANAQDLEHVAEKLRYIQREMALQARIQSLESDRAHLIPGEPCPLCGAKEHPYLEGLQGDLPSASASEIEQAQALADQKAAQAKHTALTIRQTELRKEQEQNQQAQEREEVRLHTAREAFQSTGIEDGSSAEIALLIQSQAADVDRLRERRQAAHALQAQRQSLQEQIHVQQTDLHRFQTEQQAIASQLQQAQSLCDQSLRAHEEHMQAHVEKCTQLQERLRPYGLQYTTNTATSGDLLLATLSGYAEQWKTWQNALAENTSQQEVCTQTRVFMQTSHEKSIADSVLAQERLDQQRQQLEQLQQARITCFGTQDPLALKTQLQQALETAEQQQLTHSQALVVCREAMNAHTVRAADLQQQWAEGCIQLREREALFQELLTASIFHSEADFLSAGMPSAEALHLEQTIETLRTQESAWVSRLTQVEQALTELTQSNTFTDTITDLLSQRETEETQKQELAQQLGGLRQRLADNTALKNEQQSQAQAILDQRQEMNRWLALHDLIGSSKGKKFRNFAQGLTFDVMIYYANQHLQKMTQRYLLQREQSDSLDLSIMDSFQGGDIRSTKNLSGGESFIVSLALALGLSQMASQKVRVDSLFLDEGFGTLDEEALDVALETLSGLQQENKLIGIISHVNTLKERMGTQIKVHPHNDGTSRLSGPGCKAG